MHPCTWNPEKNSHKIHYWRTALFTRNPKKNSHKIHFTHKSKIFFQNSLLRKLKGFRLKMGWPRTLTNSPLIIKKITSFLTGVAVDFASLDVLDLGWLLRGLSLLCWLWIRLTVWCCAFGFGEVAVVGWPYCWYFPVSDNYRAANDFLLSVRRLPYFHTNCDYLCFLIPNIFYFFFGGGCFVLPSVSVWLVILVTTISSCNSGLVCIVA